MSGQGTEASSTPGTCRTSQLSELLVGAVAMRLAGRKQASICLTSFSKHVPAGTPRSPHEASRSDTRSDNGSLHSGRPMQIIYPGRRCRLLWTAMTGARSRWMSLSAGERRRSLAWTFSSVQMPTKPSGQIFPGGGVLCEKPLQKVGFGALYCL